MALPHVLDRDVLALPAGDGLQLALVPVGDTIGATHLGTQGTLELAPPSATKGALRLAARRVTQSRREGHASGAR